MSHLNKLYLISPQYTYKILECTDLYVVILQCIWLHYTPPTI